MTTVAFDDLPGGAGAPRGATQGLAGRQKRIDRCADATPDPHRIHLDPRVSVRRTGSRGPRNGRCAGAELCQGRR